MIDVSKKTFIATSSALFMAAALLSGCSSSSSDDPPPVVEPDPVELERAHDGRTFVPVLPSEQDIAGLEALAPGSTVYAGLHEGERGKASYLIHMPDAESWNGTLVMYAHGFRGEGENLTVSPPRIAAHLVAAGYAWAASSYSANFYDVRVGVEDTNALAHDFAKLTNFSYGNPSKYYIIGHSMGGHIAGAAIEDETLFTANNWIPYSAAMPMCGVMGDTELFNYFSAWNVAAQKLAGIEETPTAENYQSEVLPAVREALWENYGSPVPALAGPTTAAGAQMMGIWANLSGGPRPIFAQASATTQWNNLLLGYGVPNGTITGVLNKSVLDTRDVVYRWETAPGAPLSADELEFNATAPVRYPELGANGLRYDGLRWIPKVNGQFAIPVITIHTLGDLFVPFSMQQIYAQRAIANGNSDLLVQRAIRSPGHCDFSAAEEWATFVALATWEQAGVVPAGDDILDPEVVAADDFGCEFTSDSFIDGVEDSLAATRALMPACPDSE